MTTAYNVVRGHSDQIQIHWLQLWHK